MISFDSKAIYSSRYLCYYCHKIWKEQIYHGHSCSVSVIVSLSHWFRISFVHVRPRFGNCETVPGKWVQDLVRSPLKTLLAAILIDCFSRVSVRCNRGCDFSFSRIVETIWVEIIEGTSCSSCFISGSSCRSCCVISGSGSRSGLGTVPIFSSSPENNFYALRRVHNRPHTKGGKPV